MDIDFLIGILCEDKPSEALTRNEEALFREIPELSVCKGFEQHNIWHVYDVYGHILHVVDGVPNDPIMRLTALFHDIGKPDTYTEDENGVGHFYGHWIRSREIFEDFASKHGLDESIRKPVSDLIFYHDLNLSRATDSEIEEMLSVLGKNGVTMLYRLKQSDLLAQNSQFHHLVKDYEDQKTRLLEMISE